MRDAGARRTASRTAVWLAAAAGAWACGQPPADVSHLTSQGDAGRLALDVMDAHGGLEAFHRLQDLEYTVSVEQFDSSGVLLDTARELHRFAAAPPRRYLLRRVGTRVAELGLHDDAAWARLDGLVIGRPEAAEQSRRELTVLAMLNRAPFGLADPGLRLMAMDPVEAEGERPALRRLAVERPGGDGRPPDRFVFLIDAGTGMLHEVIFESAHLGSEAPLRAATVTGLTTLDGVTLVSRWSLSPADAAGRSIGLHDTVWLVEETHADNGFTDDLDRAKVPGS